MPNCAYIKPDGTRCQVKAAEGSSWCYGHDPSREAERKHNARKGGKKAGRGRPLVELSLLKAENRRLREQMLRGELEPRMLAVAVQSINTDIRAVEATFRAKEFENQTEALAELREELERRGLAPRRAYGA
jgi:hypothetical protein